MENMTRKVERMVRKNAKRRAWRRFVAVPAAIVVFVTTYALILPAIAMERDTYCGLEAHQHTEECYTAQLTCGYEDGQVLQSTKTVTELACTASAHQHTEDCFNEYGELICGQADYLVHEHNADCYNEAGELRCPLPEVKAHTHDESCYVTEIVNVCGLEECEGHVHDESCYTVVSHPELICGQVESEGHVHDESCYTTTEHTYLACGEAESAGHIHDESCYTVTVAEDGTETMELTCGQMESIGHTHTEGCYVTEQVMELTCTLPESAGHTHTDSCFAEQSVLICDKPEVIPHVHGDECYTVTVAEDGTETRELTCPLTVVESHQHTAECFTTYEMTVETVHQHTDLCYVHALTCTLPEHEHTEECYQAPEEPETTEAPAAPEMSAEPIEGDAAEPEASAEPVEGDTAEPEMSAEPVEGDIAEPETSAEPIEGDTVEPEASAEPVEGDTAEPEASETPAEPEATEEPQFICGVEEHTHTEACYDENGELVCQIPEHTHDETCQAVEIIADEIAPAPEYFCGVEEHTHTETCYDENGALICELDEHAHTEACLTPAEIVDIDDGATPLLDRLVLICDKEEHVHGPECMDESLEYICGKQVHEHTADCYATVSDDGMIVYCGIPEHTHTETCYDENGALICALGEHTHGELCYLPPEAAELMLAASRQVKTFENDDVLVTVVYGPEANIPEKAELFAYQVTAEDDPEHYAQRVEQMKQLLMPEAEPVEALSEDIPAEADLTGDQPEEELPVLIYNIGFYLNGVEIEPTAPVTVTIHVLNEDHIPTGESYAVVHFARTGTEMLENTEQEAGVATFVTESFSDFGVVKRDGDTGADVDPLPAPGATDEPQATAEPQPTAVPQTTAEPQVTGEPETTAEPESTQLPIIMTGPAMNKDLAQNLGGGTDLGIAPMSFTFSGWDDLPTVWVDATLGKSPENYEAWYWWKDRYYPKTDYDKKTGNNTSYYEGAKNIRMLTHATDGNTTLSVMLPKEEDFFYVKGYTIRGWYDVITGDYYEPGTEVDVGTCTRNGNKWDGEFFEKYGDNHPVFYADWWPEDYSLNAPGPTVAEFDDSSFASTTVYDFNETINRTYAKPTVTSTEDSCKVTWNVPANANNDKYHFDFYNNMFQGTSDTIHNPNQSNVGHNNDDMAPTTGLADRITEILDGNEKPEDGKGINRVGQASHLYQYNSELGYYYFDSYLNSATYNVSDGRFYLSETQEHINGSDNGQFVPFNSSTSYYSPYANSSGSINYWFGMKSEISFKLTDKCGTPGGNQASTGNNMKFLFSGDDDVLVYVTPKNGGPSTLVLDMGGCHGRVYGSIDFSTGETIVGSKATSRDANGLPTYLGDTTKGTVDFEPGDYTLTIYYLERGANISNCAIYFNIVDAPVEQTDGDTVRYPTVDGVKQIDYLGDEDLNGYTLPADAGDGRDLYRLHLTAKATAEPANVLFVVDTSTAMKDYQTDVSVVLNNALDKLAETNPNSQAAIVAFNGAVHSFGGAWVSPGTAKDWVEKQLWNPPVSSGSSDYSQALAEAENLLDKVDRTNQATYMVFISAAPPTLDPTSTPDDATAALMDEVKVFGEKHEILRIVAGINSDNFKDNLGLYNGSVVKESLPLENLASDNGDGESNFLWVNNGYFTRLQQRIVDALTPENLGALNITDDLSQYVKFPADASVRDLKVTRTNKNGSIDELQEGTDYTLVGDPATGDKITVQLMGESLTYDKYHDATYELSFNVQLTEQAYKQYAESNAAAYGGTGDLGTDYKLNATSDGKKGFYSNDSANYYYEVKGSSSYEEYHHPVVQVWRPRLTVTKYGPDGVPLTGATFTLEKEGSSETYAALDKNDGTFTIDGLDSGTYILRETDAPEGYQKELKSVKFTVENGLITSMEVVDNDPTDSDTTGGWDLDIEDNNFTVSKWKWESPGTNPDYANSQWVFDYAISLTDQPDKIQLQVQKMELGNSANRPVEGAVFTLWQDNKPADAAEPYTPALDKDTDGGQDKALYKDLKSDKDGILTPDDVTRALDLEEGTYFLEETKAPDGFLMLEEPIVIKVIYNTSEGKFNVTYSGPYIGTDGVAKEDATTEGAKLWSMTIYNTYGYELPETGGTGTAVFAMSGMALIALAGAVFCARRRRAVRG